MDESGDDVPRWLKVSEQWWFFPEAKGSLTSPKKYFMKEKVLIIATAVSCTEFLSFHCCQITPTYAFGEHMVRNSARTTWTVCYNEFFMPYALLSGQAGFTCLFFRKTS